MEKLFEQITSYNILNNLLPGSIFCYALKYLVNIDLLPNSLTGELFLYYFCGVVISRVGSIVIEPALKKIKFIEFVEYKLFIKASKEDSKIEVLSESNNMYRTFIALFAILLCIKIYYYLAQKCIILNKFWPILVIVLVLVLFLMAYTKQVNYIKNRVNITLDNISN